MRISQQDRLGKKWSVLGRCKWISIDMWWYAGAGTWFSVNSQLNSTSLHHCLKSWKLSVPAKPNALMFCIDGTPHRLKPLQIPCVHVSSLLAKTRRWRSYVSAFWLRCEESPTWWKASILVRDHKPLYDKEFTSQNKKKKVSSRWNYDGQSILSVFWSREKQWGF